MDTGRRILDPVQIENIVKRLRNEIESSKPLLLKKFPVETYLEMLGRYPQIAGYHYVSAEVKSYTDNIARDSDIRTLELYHQLLLVELISRNTVEKQGLPDTIKQLYYKNFNRILANIASRSEETGFYLYPNEKFFKELDVCTGTMIPAGAEKIVTAICPKRFLLKQGPWQFFKGLGFIIFSLRGFSPLVYNMHMDSHDPHLMQEYNPEGWHRFYVNVARLMELKKEIKGIYGVGWLFDPKLEEISPRLAYLRKIVVDNGGKLFYIGPTENARIDALAKSTTRRKLYEEGKYTPTDYMVFWPRRALIKWAKRLDATGQQELEEPAGLINKLLFMLTTSVRWTKSAAVSRYRLRNKQPVHVIFCMIDHYEPGTENVGAAVAKERLDRLLTDFPALADKHRDSAGLRPKRTWFFPPHYHYGYLLKDLVSLCQKGYGEIELHLHHGKHAPDTAENLERTLRQCIKEYSLFGIFGVEKGIKKYAFVHGDWALANSRQGLCCGVDNEIEVLSKTGCFADFTLPSPILECNTRMINSIYYAGDFAGRPKSYNTGVRVKTSGISKGSLMMIQGPLFPFFRRNGPFGFRISGDAAASNPIMYKRRVDAWVRTGICVQGKPDWICIKTHMHGATEPAVLGKEMDDILSYFETRYNDGEKYILHYVSARELYNIIKAAEAGEPGNPEQYRDYAVQPPLYDSSPDIPEASMELKALIQKTFRG